MVGDASTSGLARTVHQISRWRDINSTARVQFQHTKVGSLSTEVCRKTYTAFVWLRMSCAEWVG